MVRNIEYRRVVLIRKKQNTDYRHFLVEKMTSAWRQQHIWKLMGNPARWHKTEAISLQICSSFFDFFCIFFNGYMILLCTSASHTDYILHTQSHDSEGVTANVLLAISADDRRQQHPSIRATVFSQLLWIIVFSVFHTHVVCCLISHSPAQLPAAVDVS